MPSRPVSTSELIARGLLAIGDGYRAKNTELARKGIPFARAGNIEGGFSFREADLFPLEDLHRVGSKVSQTGDVVFTSKGTVGRFAFVKSETPRFVYSPQLCFWRSLNHEQIVPRWLYYWMQGPEFLDQISYLQNQTDMAAYVSLGDQRKVSITLPQAEDQTRIAAVLSALDDRIDHNRALAANLEAIALALFKSWFVDFDPVRAKAAGDAPPGLAPDLAALFPDRFVDSALGGIPEGWAMRTIADLAEVVGGSTPSTKNDDYWFDGQHHWATPKDLAALSSPVLLGTERKVTDAGLALISSGLLAPGTVLLSSRAPIGYLAIAVMPVAINQGFIAMKPKTGVSNLYLLYWAQTSHEAIVANANGSTFLEISKKNFRPIPALDAGAAVMAAFDSVAAPLFERVVCAEKEIATLNELRDLLLPRLISGKLRVEDAEAVLEAA